MVAITTRLPAAHCTLSVGFPPHANVLVKPIGLLLCWLLVSSLGSAATAHDSSLSGSLLLGLLKQLPGLQLPGLHEVAGFWQEAAGLWQLVVQLVGLAPHSAGCSAAEFSCSPLYVYIYIYTHLYTKFAFLCGTAQIKICFYASAKTLRHVPTELQISLASFKKTCMLLASGE